MKEVGQDAENTPARRQPASLPALMAMATSASVAVLVALAIRTHDPAMRWTMGAVAVVVLATDVIVLLALRARGRKHL